jgi:hypothetical protein
MKEVLEEVCIIDTGIHYTVMDKEATSRYKNKKFFILNENRPTASP